MNKKLRIFLCSLFSVIAVSALAFAVGCDSETSSSSSDSSTTTSTNTENTGSENTGSGTSGSETTTPDYDLDNATWSWTENFDGSYSVTVTVTDKNGGTDLTVTADNVTVTSEVKTAATCTSKGTTTYTATFTYGGNTYTATKDVETAIDPDNHTEELTLVEGVASTDDTDGTIAYYTCSACEAMYAESTGKTALSATDIVIAHKASSVPTAISMPDAAGTTATTSAVLNSSNSSFDLEYEVTTSGTYTIKLVCEDLHDLSVGVYNSWYGSYPVGTLQDAESYTISYDYAAGETLEIYALLSTTKLYPVTFSVEISYTEKEVTRPAEGYYEGGAIYIGGSSYSYSADMTVTADDDSSNTLYYYTSGGTGVDLTLTVTSSDTTFTVYGYNTTDGETEYSAWTLDENNSITFTVGARKNAYIKITCDSLTMSGAESGTITVSLAEAEEEADYLEETTYNVSSYETIELVAQTAGYYTFKVDENGEVELTVEGSTETFTDGNGETLTYNDGRWFGSDEEVYEVTVYIGANVNVSLYAWSSASSVTVTYSATSGDNGTSIPTSLSTGDNKVVLDATDGSSGTTGGPYTLANGSYTLSITSTADAYITVSVYDADWNTKDSFTLSADDYLSYDITIEDGYFMYIKFYSYSYNAASYVLTVTDKNSNNGTSIPTSLSTGDNKVVLDATDGSSGTTGGPYTLANGSYTLSITSTADAYITVSVYDADWNTKDSFTLSADDYLSYDITIEDGYFMYIKFYSYSYNAASYVLTVTDKNSSTSGTTTTTTIASIDFTTLEATTYSETAEWSNVTDSEGTDTGFDVIGKIGSSYTAATVKSQNSTMTLNFSGGLLYTEATEEGGEATISSALRYYLATGTYTVTVSYFGPKSTDTDDKSGRYAIVMDADGNTISDEVTDEEKTGTDQTVVTRTMEITVEEDGYIYIGSASSGLYITSVTITQTTTAAAE